MSFNRSRISFNGQASLTPKRRSGTRFSPKGLVFSFRSVAVPDDRFHFYVLVADVSDCESDGNGYRRQDEPFWHVYGLAGKDRMTKNADDEGMVEIRRIRKSRDPFERTVIEKPTDFFRICDGKQSDSQ